MPVYEMFWDCESCGSEKLLGKTHRHCPSCGAPQDPKRRYFPRESEKVAVADHIYVGIDRNCAACKSANAAIAAHCINCGAAMGDTAQVSRQQTVRKGSQSGLRADAPKTTKPATTKPETAKPTEIPAPPTAAQRQKRQVKFVVATMALLAAILIPLLLWSRPITVEVTGHHWERKVHIEVFSSIDDGTWCSQMPLDAYSIEQSTRQSGTVSVPDGEECSYQCSTFNVDNGDGTFSQEESCDNVCVTTYREDPVYDEWCDYSVDRWVQHSTERANGVGLTPSPSWPTYTVSDCSNLGCTRVGGTDEDYAVELKDSTSDEHDCSFSQERWSTMLVGQEYDARKRVLTGWLVCSDVE